MRRLLAAAALLASGSGWAQGPAAPLTLEAALQANVRPLRLTEGRLSGPGADLLLAEGVASRFFVIGEQHVSKEIPEFTSALFQELNARAGYGHLALEQDPAMGRAVSRAPLVGDREAVFRYARRYPNAFTFSNDEEIAMIAYAGRIARRRGDPVWGVDQVFGALHVLDRLETIAPNPAARRLTHELIALIRPFETGRFAPGRRFISGDGPVDQLERLRTAFRPRPGSEADFLIGQLLKSVDIYRDYQSAQRGLPTKYRQTYEREENMKALFMDGYRRSRRAGDAAPKVLLKTGHQHAIRGQNWSGVLSLGDFVSALATAEGSRSFHLAVYMNNDQAGYYDILRESPRYGPLARAAPTDRWAVVDLRPLRGPAYANQLHGLNEELRRLIFGFDAVLLIGGGSRGSYERSGGRP